MYNLSDLPKKVNYCNWRFGMVFTGTVNYLTTITLSILFTIGQPLKCIPITHQNFQSPQASGRPLNAHPEYLAMFMKNIFP